MSLQVPCLVDTNVAKTANLATQPDTKTDVTDACIIACIEAIDQVIKSRGLILDAGDEIFTEYRQQLSLRGQPGVGDRFMKWVHDHRWSLPPAQRVAITPNAASYDEFPSHEDLASFDPSDQKFVAVSNAHPHKPPILQATDSKWWGWQTALAQVGIRVCFLCPAYVKRKFTEKMG